MHKSADYSADRVDSKRGVFIWNLSLVSVEMMMKTGQCQEGHHEAEKSETIRDKQSEK